MSNQLGEHGDSLVKQPRTNYAYAAATRRRVAEKLTDIKACLNKAEAVAAETGAGLATDMAGTKQAVACVAEVFRNHLPENAIEVN